MQLLYSVSKAHIKIINLKVSRYREMCNVIMCIFSVNVGVFPGGWLESQKNITFFSISLSRRKCTEGSWVCARVWRGERLSSGTSALHNVEVIFSVV